LKVQFDVMNTKLHAASPYLHAKGSINWVKKSITSRCTIAFAAMAAMSVCVGHAQIVGALWQNQQTAAENAVLGYGQSGNALYLGTPDATFTVSGFNYNPTDSSTVYTLSSFLNHPTFNNQSSNFSTPAAGYGPNASLKNTYFYFTGSIFLNAGTNYFLVGDDDGAQLNIDGIGLVLDKPRSFQETFFTVTAPAAGTYHFELSYAEAFLPPAQLVWEINFQTVGSTLTSTNATTGFVIGKTYQYLQNSAGAPTPNPFPTCDFIATTSLSSNQSANAVSLTLASGGTSNLMYTIVNPGEYILVANETNSAQFESIFPQGDYVFDVRSTSSNELVTVTLPASMPQPNAPHVSNYDAAQSMNPSLPFTLTWDPFTGGTTTDIIFLAVGDKTFQTPSPGTNGALNGLATQVTIPAGALVPNSNYVAQLIFFHTTGTSNATYTTGAYRASVTQFHINTGGTGSPAPLMSSPIWSGGALGFDVATSPGTPLKVLFSTDLSQPAALWTTVVNTNPTGTSVHITVPPQIGSAGFFRIQN
jgi:hypothetical protein